MNKLRNLAEGLGRSYSQSVPKTFHVYKQEKIDHIGNANKRFYIVLFYDGYYLRRSEYQDYKKIYQTAPLGTKCKQNKQF